MNLKEAIQSELIGKDIVIKASKNKLLRDMTGTIIDETKETLSVKTKNGVKKLIKNQIVFEAKIKNQNFKINGSLIRKKPEDRLK